MARCGPAPMTLTELAALDGRTAAAMQARLDRGDAAPLQRGGRGVELRLVSTLGRSGAQWHARRVAGQASIVLDAFATGISGAIDGLVLDSDAVFWRNGPGDSTRNRPPEMASGEELADSKDYVAFLRERYIIGDVGPPRDDEDFIDRSTWSDAAADGLGFETAGPDTVAISDAKGRSYAFDLKTGAVTAAEPPPPFESRWDGEDIRNRDGYSSTIERGPAGPLVLSTWERGSVRVRDGRTGRVIGESLSDQSQPLFRGTAVAMVPGTEWIAGYFWWKGRIVAGVADLRNQRLLARFDRAPEPDSDLLYPATFAVSPDGREATFTIRDRHERYFAAWDVKSGKLLYGPFSAGMGEEDTPQITPDHFWHPGGSFVAIRHGDGPTELRRGFGSAPFARLAGVAPSPAVREIGDPTRVLIGNWVVDRARWEPVLALPHLWISPDGRRTVIVNRPGVVEIVRPGFRHAPANRRESALLHQIRLQDRSRR